MKTRVTRKDVAALAKVSETTVSVVMNNNTDIAIADDTRKKVLHVAKDLGYYPSHAAKTMAGKKSHTIGVLSPWNVEVWYFAQMLNGIRDTALQNEYGVLLCSMLKNNSDVEDCIKYFHQGRIDGIIYLPPMSMDLPVLNKIRGAKIPVTLCNGIFPPKNISSVFIDYASGIYDAAKYLAGEGYEQLLYILPDHEDKLCPGDANRLKGYKKAASELRSQKADVKIFHLDYDVGMRVKKASEIINQIEKPTGIITCHWYQAYYLQQVVLCTNTQLGTDVKIISGDKPEFTENLFPKITGIELPFYELGKLSSQLLIDFLEGKTKQMKCIKIHSGISGSKSFQYWQC